MNEFFLTPGDVLLSRRAAPQVPSALESLTSVFGMGTGVSFPLLPPDSVVSVANFPPMNKQMVGAIGIEPMTSCL